MIHNLVVGVLICLSVLGLGEKMGNVPWQAPCRGFVEVESVCVMCWNS